MENSAYSNDMEEKTLIKNEKGNLNV